MKPRPAYGPESIAAPEIEPPELLVDAPQTEKSVDWLTVLFLMAAGLALVAMIPVGFFIYQFIIAPSPTPAPTPTPRPVVSAEPPPEPPPSLDLGLFRIPLLSLGGLGLALALVAGLVGFRSRRARRG